MVGEQWNVVAPSAKRGDPDDDHVQAVVEVFAEGASRDLVFEVGVGGGDDPHVDGGRLVGTNAFDFAFLQGAQELPVALAKRTADFVEEDRALVGRFEEPDPRVDCAGEGPPHVPEELTLDQVDRNGRTVDC